MNLYEGSDKGEGTSQVSSYHDYFAPFEDIPTHYIAGDENYKQSISGDGEALLSELVELLSDSRSSKQAEEFLKRIVPIIVGATVMKIKF